MLLSGAGSWSREQEPEAGTGAGSKLDRLHNTAPNSCLLSCLQSPVSYLFVFCLFSPVTCLLSPVSGPLLLSPFSCLLSPVSCICIFLLSPVSFSCLLFPISCFLSLVSCLLSFVSCLLSPVSRLRLLSHVSCLNYPASPILLKSSVSLLPSHVSCLFQVSCLTSSVSCLTGPALCALRNHAKLFQTKNTCTVLSSPSPLNLVFFLCFRISVKYSVIVQ